MNSFFSDEREKVEGDIVTKQDTEREKIGVGRA